MKPIARLYLNRQRVYEKTCEPNSQENTTGSPCEVTGWSIWSDCNTKCGPGRKYKQREYINPNAAENAYCKKTLTWSETCNGIDCDADDFNLDQDRQNDENPSDPDCALTVRIFRV